MNRAARIAAKAPAGQLWCSDDVWRSCCSSAAAVDGRGSSNGNNRTSGSGGTAGCTSFTLTAAPPRNATDTSEGRTAGDELYDGRERRLHVSQHGEYGRDSAVQKQYSVMGRYMGRHVLKGVSGPMELWHCRWVHGPETWCPCVSIGSTVVVEDTTTPTDGRQQLHVVGLCQLVPRCTSIPECPHRAGRC